MRGPHTNSFQNRLQYVSLRGSLGKAMSNGTRGKHARRSFLVSRRRLDLMRSSSHRTACVLSCNLARLFSTVRVINARLQLAVIADSTVSRTLINAFIGAGLHYSSASKVHGWRAMRNTLFSDWLMNELMRTLEIPVQGQYCTGSATHRELRICSRSKLIRTPKTVAHCKRSSLSTNQHLLADSPKSRARK